MSSDLDVFMVHTVTVRTLLGTAGMGTQWATPVTLSPADGGGGGVFVDDKRRLVRGTDASQVVSESTVYDVDLTHADLWAPGSEVDLPSGRTATVITTATLTSGPLNLPDHLAVALT